jgi:hypothetical protein
LEAGLGADNPRTLIQGVSYSAVIGRLASLEAALHLYASMSAQQKRTVLPFHQHLLAAADEVIE